MLYNDFGTTIKIIYFNRLVKFCDCTWGKPLAAENRNIITIDYKRQKEIEQVGRGKARQDKEEKGRAKREVKFLGFI